MPVILQPRAELNLHTRCENQIENEIARRQPIPGDWDQSNDLRADYPRARHRPMGPCPAYNCHGMTFASRRTVISKPTEVAKILHDDEYVTVTPLDIQVGDIVIYHTIQGDVEHSGLVVADQPVIKILSKWGLMHEVIHEVSDCPYNGMQVTYYRNMT
jgi:hypothetical protein